MPDPSKPYLGAPATVVNLLQSLLGRAFPTNPTIGGARQLPGFLNPTPQTRYIDPVGAISALSDVLDAPKAAAGAALTAGAPLLAMMRRGGVEAAAEVPGFIKAFHGTGAHPFREFKSAEIGTGQGAQSFGHGLYFAENPKVAASYQAKLGKGAGAMYEVGLKVQPDDLLDWDTPLSSQNPKIQEAMKRLPQEVWDSLEQMEDFGLNPIVLGDTDYTAGEFVRALGRVWDGDHEAVSAVLRDVGIPGLRYLDKGSRSTGSGTRNIVVFPGSEDLIEPKSINEIPIKEFEQRTGIKLAALLAGAGIGATTIRLKQEKE